MCNECGARPKRPGQGQRFCSDECRAASALRWKKPDREKVRERARRRRRASGQRERPPTWDANGDRLCPHCAGYFPLKSIKGGYCLTCLPLKRRDGALRSKYGITLEDYEQMRLKQDGRCAICLEPPERLDVDHCHATGVVRGLLCIRCIYQLLGIVNDDAELLRRAADYLERT